MLVTGEVDWEYTTLVWYKLKYKGGEGVAQYNIQTLRDVFQKGGRLHVIVYTDWIK